MKRQKQRQNQSNLLQNLDRVLRGRWLWPSLLVGATLSACADYELTDEDLRTLEQEAISPVTVSFQQGTAPSTSYTGSTDATLRQATPTTNNGGATTCNVDGDDGNGVDLSCALRWDVSSIPAGSTVQSVTMTFRVVDPSSNVYSIFALSRGWNESQVTWNNAASGDPWAVPGALGSADRGPQIGTLTGSTGTRTAVLNSSAVSVVQGWVNGQLNAGIVIAHANNTNGLDLASTEHATASYRPRLTVTYLPPDTSGPTTVQFRRGSLPNSSYTGTKDATMRQASPTTSSGTATTCEVDGDDGSGVDLSCALAFDVSQIPMDSIVDAASLTIQVTNPSPNTYPVYALKRAFSESQITWNHATSSTPWATPGALGSTDRGAQIGSITPSSTGSYHIPLNSAGVALVQGWVDGQPSTGFVFAHPTNTDGLDFATSEHATVSYRPTLSVTYRPSGSNGGSGGSGSGGSSSGGSGGTSGTATQQNLLVAFIGDQGNGSNATNVLNLIKNEGAAAVVHNGDFDYVDNPSAWETRINNVLGANYPYFAVIGNHDAAAWGGTNGYASYVNARVSRVPDMQCTGENGVRANCVFRGLHLVQSCIGTGELRSSCGKDSSDQVGFIQNSLASDDHLWSVCSWHKNQRAMQVGTKSDEVGWQAYQACMNAGAMISTGHEHSYSRTLTLTNVGNTSAGHGATGAHDLINIGPGRTFAFVSGLGGVGLRAFSTTYHNNDTWWSSYYTSDRWMRHGVMQSGTGNYGALFIRFYVDGDPKKASAYFKDVSGRIVDTFTMRLD